MSNIVAHDTSEPRVGLIIWTISLFTLFLGLLVVFSYFWYKSLLDQELSRKENTKISIERRQLRIYEDEVLDGYRWTNKSKELVQIPISAAIPLLVEDYRR